MAEAGRVLGLSGFSWGFFLGLEGLGVDEERPEGGSGGDDDGRGGCVGVQSAVPVAEEVGRLVEALGF